MLRYGKMKNAHTFAPWRDDFVKRGVCFESQKIPVRDMSRAYDCYTDLHDLNDQHGALVRRDIDKSVTASKHEDMWIHKKHIAPIQWEQRSQKIYQYNQKASRSATHHPAEEDARGSMFSAVISPIAIVNKSYERSMRR